MLLSRALSLATVTLLIGCCGMGQVEAQENLEAGKSPSQIFAGTCNVCHKSPRGLLKTVAPGSLPGFLRQHYTTSPEMAGVLSSYLISNGATDTRYSGGAQPKGAKEPKPEARPASEAPAAQGEPGRPGHNARRPVRPEASEAAKPAGEGQVPAQAAGERAHEDIKSTGKQRLGKRGKPAPEEAPKAAAEPAKEEAGGGEGPKVESKPESKPESKTEAAKIETGKPEGTKPAEGSSQSAIAEPAKESETPALRPDPVPPVAPAPSGSASQTPSAAPATAAAAPAAVSGSSSSDVPAPVPAMPAEPPAPPAPPAVTASAPPQPPVAPVAPAGPPIPPISK